jgi:hypothetical protein
MTVLITLTVAGADSGPFNLFSNLDGYTSAFAVGISKAALLAGYSSSVVPDGTTIVRVVSIGDCTNYIDIVLSSLITTTTTTIAPTTTTTTSGVPCISYEMIGVLDGPGCVGFVNYSYTDCSGVFQLGSFSVSSSETVCGQSLPTITCGSATINNLGPCLP